MSARGTDPALGDVGVESLGSDVGVENQEEVRVAKQRLEVLLRARFRDGHRG